MEDSSFQALLVGGGLLLLPIMIGIIWFVSCIVLFFKIWKMTNDVVEIKELFKEKMNLEHPYKVNKSDDIQTDE